MDQKEFTLEKKLAELKHKFRKEEIELEKAAKMEVENFKFESMKSMHRLKRADRKRESTERDFHY